MGDSRAIFDAFRRRDSCELSFLGVGTINAMGFPPVQGLYDPRNEHDACGMGFIAHIKGVKSHAIIGQALEILRNLDHRGAVGADPLLGDGAGLLIQLPDQLFRKWAAGEGKELPQPGDYAVAVRHDANANGKSDWNDGGGFTRNPHLSVFKLKPAFAATAVAITNRPISVPVIMQYRKGLMIGPSGR